MIRRIARKIPRKNEGVALVVTLLIVALLVSVITEFNRAAVAEIELSGNFGDDKKLLFTMISSVEALAEFLRLDALYSPFDTLSDRWAKSEAFFEKASAMLEEGTIRGEVIDEDGKINVNSLVTKEGVFDKPQKAVWERLLAQPRFGLDEDTINTIIHSVKDWIDPDDKKTEIYGTEEAFYAAKGYHCANAPLGYLEEMLLINGVTRDVFYGNGHRSGLKPYLTVYGGGAVNVNTAPVPVLMALSEDMSEDAAVMLDEYRRDEANRNTLARTSWPQEVWPLLKPISKDLVTTSSKAFSLLITGSLRENTKQVRAVVLRSKTSARIVFWQES